MMSNLQSEPTRVERDSAAERLDIGLDRLGRGARGARRAIEAVADLALDTQRRVIDRDRDFLEREAAAASTHLELEAEIGAELEPFERARLRFVEPPTERHLDRRVGLDVAERERLADQRDDLPRIAAADSRTLEHAHQFVARGELSADVDDRPLGRVLERRYQIGRRNAVAGAAALAERRDRLRLARLPVGDIARGRHVAVDRILEAGRKQVGQRAQPEASGGAAIPGERSDPRAEIGREFEIGEAPLHASRPSRRFTRDSVVAQEQGAMPPKKVARAASPGQGRISVEARV